MLQGCTESGIFQQRPQRQLVHRRCVFRPDREIARILRKTLLKRPHGSRVFIKKHRSVSGRKTAFDLLLCACERIFGHDRPQRPFHDLPERSMMFVQKQHQPRGLRIERRRRVLDCEPHHLFDLRIRHRRLARQTVVAAAAFENLFASFFHGRMFSHSDSKNGAIVRIFRCEALSLLS